MHHDHNDDRELRDALHEAAPAARFESDRLRRRIARSISDAESPSGGRVVSYRWFLIRGGQIAAALALFAGGLVTGRMSQTDVGLPASYVADATWGVVPPGQVPISIQGAGTGYIAALSLYADFRDRLTPAQREEARQVALAVLSGALAELAAAEEGGLPSDVLETVLRFGGSDEWAGGEIPMNARVLSLFALAIPFGLDAQGSCGDRAWSSIGVGAFHCPGGRCVFTGARNDTPPAFTFGAEPWLRGVDPDGPAAGRIEEGDALVAVNGAPVTTRAGGAALARLNPSRAVELVIRRQGRLREVQVQPRMTCRNPLMLTGNAIIERGDAVPPPGGSAGNPLIDYSQARRLSETAVDEGLGMVLRCPSCEFLPSPDRGAWSVTAPPVVETVVPGGVADEAGLQPGDEIHRINGRDVRDDGGRSPLFALPRGDFTIEFERAGQFGTAFMNRRIVDQRIVVRRDRIVQVERTGNRGDRLLGVLANAWRALTGLVTNQPVPRIIAHGDTWGPEGLGLLFHIDRSPLFTVENVDGQQVLRFASDPAVAEVHAGGPGDRAGLEPGDVITHVDGHALTTPDGAVLLLGHESGVRLSITYTRAGRTHQTTLVPLEEQ